MPLHCQALRFICDPQKNMRKSGRKLDSTRSQRNKIRINHYYISVICYSTHLIGHNLLPPFIFSHPRINNGCFFVAGPLVFVVCACSNEWLQELHILIYHLYFCHFLRRIISCFLFIQHIYYICKEQQLLYKIKKGWKTCFNFVLLFVIIHFEWNNIIPCGFFWKALRNFVCQSQITTNIQVAFRNLRVIFIFLFSKYGFYIDSVITRLLAVHCVNEMMCETRKIWNSKLIMQCVVHHVSLATGVLIYEMLCGYPPFSDDNNFSTYEKILSGKIDWPKSFDPIAKDLVKKLLTNDRTKRIGCMKVSKQEHDAWKKLRNWNGN